jgi:hypothetical protein
MLVAWRSADRAVLRYGRGKNERDNIDPGELLTLREIGAAWLTADAQRIVRAVAEEALQEVGGDEADEDQQAGPGVA